MIDSSALIIDKQIQQLLSIKLGLQKHSDKIFKQLMDGKSSDPLDSIYKSLVNKNQRIKILQQKLLQKQQEIQKYQIQRTQKPNEPLFSASFRSNSAQPKIPNLPTNFQAIMKSHGENMKEATEKKDRYRKRTEDFIIFLLKCIREISKAQIHRAQDVEQLVGRLENSLRKQSLKIIQQPDPKIKIKNASEASTKASQQNLDNLIKQINQQKDKQLIFCKISKSLGLQIAWDTFINSYKQRLKMLQLMKKVIKFQNKQNTKSQKLSITEFQQLKQKKLHFTQLSQKFVNRTQQLVITQNSLMLDEMLQSRKKALQLVPQRAFQLLKSTMISLYENLDKMFAKHNQYPFQCHKRASFVDSLDKVKQLLLKQQWVSADQLIKQQIKQAFYLIQRRTKFHSNNRLIVRNKV